MSDHSTIFDFPATQDIEPSLNSLCDQLYEKINTFQHINQFLSKGLLTLFPFYNLSCFIIDPYENKIIDSYSETELWNISQSEKDWIIKQAKIDYSKSNKVFHVYYITDRSSSPFTDPIQYEMDRQVFNYSCNDGIYVILYSEEGAIYSICFFHNWIQKQPVLIDKSLQNYFESFSFFFQAVEVALDNLFIHEKIEGLLSDKKLLTQKIQKDEEDLQRRILELTVLYDTSNSLGYSLNYEQIIQLVVRSLHKVIAYDVCSVFLLDFLPGGEIITTLNVPVSPEFLKQFHSNVISASMPFINHFLDPDYIKVKTENKYDSAHDDTVDMNDMQSFANIPLIFKEEVIGMISLCAKDKHMFEHNEMTFLHTMANQLGAHLGRLKTVKQAEKSKIRSLIRSMTEGVIMFDESNNLELINPSALNLFNFSDGDHITTHQVYDRFKLLGILETFQSSTQSNKAINNLEVADASKSFLLTISPVFSLEKTKIGTVVVIKDFTEIQKISRVKTQRLEVISKVNLIIRSISDIDNLLTVLMEFILNIANAEMGSIQLIEGRKLITRVHSNFPDKIRRQYQFLSGETISEYVKRTKEQLYISDYMSQTTVNQDTKISIDSYLCLPIMIKKNLLGILSIAQKTGVQSNGFSQDDILTLTTITSLSGTAIENALLYRETLQKQRLDQEIKVAYEIQSKLLPQSIPNIDHFQFGGISVPATEIGGDYYDFFQLSDNEVGIIIADIVGKGISAGLYMAILKSILHTHIREFSSPKEALSRLNDIVFHDPVVTRFIPIFYGILNTSTRKFVYTNAGHEPPLLNSDNTIRYLDTRGFPVGAYLESDFEEQSVILNDQDLLLFYTDGIVDARNIDKVRFGHTKLESYIKHNKHQTAHHICEDLYDSIKMNFQHQSQSDDLTIVCVKVDSSIKPHSVEVPMRSKKIRITSSKKNVKKIRSEVDQLGLELKLPKSDIFNLKLAINEAHANVIEHAYAGREDGEIIFIFDLFDDRIAITIKDFGRGFGQKTIKDESHLDEIEGSGLGLFLIESLMDEIKYKKFSKLGTELKMVKYFEGGKNGIAKDKS